MSLARRSLSLARIARDFKARRETVRARPVRLRVESSSHCNLRCGMCLNRVTPAAEIDGFGRGVYERVRVGASFDATVENLFRPLRLRRERRQRCPYIVIEKVGYNRLRRWLTTAERNA